MKTLTGNLWDFQTQVKVIPTNGIHHPANHIDGHIAVMGAGVARQAAERWRMLQLHLGNRLAKYGNRLFVFDVHAPNRLALGCTTLVTLPTKDDWKDKSNENRLTISVRQLAAAQKMHDWSEVYMPEPGTGHGGLAWTIVEPILQEYLDDHFTVVRLENT